MFAALNKRQIPQIIHAQTQTEWLNIEYRSIHNEMHWHLSTESIRSRNTTITILGSHSASEIRINLC